MGEEWAAAFVILCGGFNRINYTQLSVDNVMHTVFFCSTYFLMSRSCFLVDNSTALTDEKGNRAGGGGKADRHRAADWHAARQIRSKTRTGGEIRTVNNSHHPSSVDGLFANEGALYLAC